MLQPPDLEEFRGCFTGNVISSPPRCTATDNGPCQIIAQIPVCNELLYNVQLELQEFSPGQLSLTSLDYVNPKSDSVYKIEQAFRLLSCLLSNHRCIASLHIKPWNSFPKYEALISSSYHATSNLKSLRLGGKEWLIQTVAPTLPFLTGLEELDFGVFKHPHELISPLCCLITKSRTLKKLSLSYWNMRPREASLFCCTLSTNATLTELSINCSCIVPEGGNCSAEFAASLEKITTLKTLAISCDAEDRSGELKDIVEAVGRSKSLVNFCLLYFLIDNEASVSIEDLLTKNCSLTSFSMKFCEWYRELDDAAHSYSSTDKIDATSTRIRPWINILQQNRSLEELRLNLEAFSPAECRAFFAELRKTTSLKRVVVEDLDWYFHCRGILACRDSVEGKADVSALDRPDVLITQCEQLSHVFLWFYDEQDVTWMKMALGALASCSHVTKLTIDIPFTRLEDQVGGLMADYIRNTTTLKELRLTLPWVSHNVTMSAVRVRVIEALKDNSSLRKLFLANEAFTEEEAALFTAMLISSKNIYDLEIVTCAKCMESLVDLLYLGFSRNYTLVSLRSHWTNLPLPRHFYFVKNIVRRNHDLVTRAAHCANGNHSRWCAEALELVAENPALIEKICELQSVGEKNAEQIVRHSHDTLLGLEDYMRVTGVVKSHVSCSSSEDIKLQLDDLDAYSWLNIRRLLRLSDVLPCASSCARQSN